MGLVAASVAAKYVVTHPQPSHTINNLSFFALKKEFLSFVGSMRWGIITNHVANMRVCSFHEYFLVYTGAMGIGQIALQAGGMFVLRPYVLKKYGLGYRFSYIAKITEKSADLFFLSMFLLNAILFLMRIDIYLSILVLGISIIFSYIIYNKFGFIFENIAYIALRKIEHLRNRNLEFPISGIGLDDLRKIRFYPKIAGISIMRIFILSL